MKSECLALASKIRETLSALNRATADKVATERQQADAKKTVEVLLAQGAADDEAAVARVATENGRLLFFPAKLKQIEGNIASAQAILADDILAAQKLQSRAATYVTKRLTEEVEALLSPLISDRHLREGATRSVVQAADANLQAGRAVTNHFDGQVRGADSDRLVQMANSAASSLEAIS